VSTSENKLLVSLVGLFFAALLSGIFAVDSRAAGYPERPITVIMPYPPGGVTDSTARALAEGLSHHLKQPVVVMNRPGAGGTIGANAVATAAPDGYTLGFFPMMAAAPEAFRFGYEARYSSTDFRAIASVAATAMSFVVKFDSPLQSMKEVVELARKSGGLPIGVTDKQNLPSMILIKIAAREGVKLELVPYGGDSKTLPALLGGHVPVAAIDYSVVRGLVDAKKVRLLAVCTENRLNLAPDVPTVGELGYELPYRSVVGLFGPKGLPDDMVKILQDLVGTITKESRFIDRMKQLSIQPAFKDAATYQQSLFRDRDNLREFFRRQDEAMLK